MLSDHICVNWTMGKAFRISLILLTIIVSASSQNIVFDTLPVNQTVVEGGDATFACSGTVDGTSQPTRYRIRIGVTVLQSVGRNLSNLSAVDGIEAALVFGETNSQLLLRNIAREANNYTVSCSILAGATFQEAMNTPPAHITVTHPPTYNLLPNQPTTVLEGDDFTYSFGFEATPPSANFTWSRGGQVISSGGRIVTSVSIVNITNTTRSDSGVYEVVSYNEAGRGAGNFTLDVQFPPEYVNVDPVKHTQLTVGAPFTLNCTPSAASPPVDTVSIEVDGSPVTSGESLTVADNVLTIPSVQRSHSGNYSCTATNTRGSAVIYNNLLVVGPPSAPRDVNVSDVRSFTAQLTWTAPEDDGGISDPSWDPSLDSRENRPYLNYTVTLTNRTVTTMATTQALSLNLTLLQHSTSYSVTVEAENMYGRGPVGNASFNTSDSVPIIDSVEVAVLSLFEVEVNISLLTNGGRNVLQYTVEVNGTEHPFLSSEQMHVSILVNQLRVNFTKGERVTLRAFAVNSVGTSDPTSVDVIVPSPPNITAPPTELSTTNIPVCCAGVKLNLANPDSPIDVRVLVNGTLHPPNQVTRNGSFLYFMGLQAGTEYSLNITLSNIFGTVWVNTTVRPLLGRPSTPQVALTPTAGGLTVQLTVMYPGTREDTLQYSISTSPSPLSRRQTGQQPLPVTNLTTPISGSAEVALGPGTYSVTVTVTNQHGSTTSVPQQVAIPAPATDPPATDPPAADPPPPADTAVIIGVVVAVVIVILLIILAVFIIVLFCMKRRDTKAMYKPKSEGSGDADYKEMVDTNSTDPLAPQYEDPSTLERQAPPPVVTYKKEEEAVAVQPAPAASGVVYADLDFSRQQAFGSKKPPEKKKPEPIEPVIYSEVRPMTPQEKEPHSPTTIM